MNTKLILMLVVSLGISFAGYAQNFNKVMRQQKATINTVYRRHKITEREYYKLMAEQDDIGKTIAKYSRDGYLSYSEKNKIAAKQQKAAERIRKYQHNNERY